MIKKIILAVVSLLLCATFLNAAEAGKIVGGANHDVPSWFKLSFLDITDDAQEAQKNNKHLMIFMDLDGCPYCAQMLSESFFPKNKTSDFIKANFDVIKTSITGSKDVTWDETTIMSEKEFAKKMQVYSTPTILFLDGDKNVVARVDGYRSKENFLNILEYVNGKHYTKMELDQFLEKVKIK